MVCDPSRVTSVIPDQPWIPHHADTELNLVGSKEKGRVFLTILNRISGIVLVGRASWGGGHTMRDMISEETLLRNSQRHAECFFGDHVTHCMSYPPR